MVRSRDQWLGVGITKSLCVYVFILCNVILCHVILCHVMSCHFVSCHVNAWAWHAHRGERFLIRVLIWRDQHGMVWYVCCTLYVCMYACMCDQSMHACMYVVHTYIALHCNTLLCIALYCIAVYCIALYYITFTLHYIALHCITFTLNTFTFTFTFTFTLHNIKLHCIALHYITYIYIYTCTYGYIWYMIIVVKPEQTLPIGGL